jgi:hypothetical protein
MTDTTTLDRLEQILARLERLEGVAPQAAVDNYGNPAHVAAGELIESAWGDSVAEHVVLTFPTYTEIAAAAGVPAGQMAVAKNTSMPFVKTATAWATLVQQTGTAVGPGGNYAAGTPFVGVTIPAAPTARRLSFCYSGLIGSQPAQNLDLTAHLNGVPQVTWRCQPGITQSVCVARHDIALPAGTTNHTLTITNVGSTVTLVADPNFNQLTWVAMPALG